LLELTPETLLLPVPLPDLSSKSTFTLEDLFSANLSIIYSTYSGSDKSNFMLASFFLLLLFSFLCEAEFLGELLADYVFVDYDSS
jgi:hypothetical protein